MCFSTDDAGGVRGLMSRAERLATAGRFDAAERLLKTAADRAAPHARAELFRCLVRLSLRSGRPAAAAIWNQQAISAATSAGEPPDLALAVAVAAAVGDETWGRPPLEPPQAPSVSPRGGGSLTSPARLASLAAWCASTGDWTAAAAAAELAVRRSVPPADADYRRLRAAIAALAALDRGPHPAPGE